MHPLTVHWTQQYPNPRRDLSPSPTITVVAYTAPNGYLRIAAFGDHEDWRRLLPIFVDRDMKLWNALTKTLTV